jgi:putative endonuclease
LAVTPWFVYVLLSASGRTYVGIAIEVERRLAQHNGEARGGARTTRAGRPWRVGVVYGPFADRGAALRAELAVKRLRGPRRLAWVAPEAPGNPGSDRSG